MKLPELCIRQPVLAIVMSLVLVVLGLASFHHLELRFFPKMKLPIVTVETYYQGASAPLMETQVSTLIENSLAGIDNVADISSKSSAEHSTVTVLFRLGGDFEVEASAVRDSVFGLRDKLPANAQLPTITVGAKGNPVLGIGFIDKSKSTGDIRNYVERIVEPQLRQLKGVGEVDTMGGSDYAMRIWLNASKMAALGVTVSDVKSALTANNVYFPAGSIQGPTRNFGIVSHTNLTTAHDFANIIVRHTAHGTVRFADIARVALGNTTLYQAPLRINGQHGLELLIKPLQDANPINVAQEVKHELKRIAVTFPPEMHASVNYDASRFLQGSIDETFLAIVEAIALVIIIVFLFLGSLRAASIPIVTIPVSLIGVFAVMQLLGFTINTMSLLGMVLAIGLVVDDAIVILENIHRHIEAGLSPMQAAIKGSREIGFAIVAMTLTLLAVYAPIGFMQGFTAELFKEFAFTLAGAVVISGFVALTLSPMMCAKILVPLDKHPDNRYTQFIDRTFNSLSQHYQNGLQWVVTRRLWVVLALVVVAGCGCLIYLSLPSQLVPKEDIGLVDVSIHSPTGASLFFTEKHVGKIEAMIKQLPSMQSIVSQIYSSGANLRITLKNWGQRHQTTAQVVEILNKEFENVPAVNANAYQPDIINYGVGGDDIELNFMTTRDYQSVLEPIAKMMKLLKGYPGLMAVDTNLKFDSQQYAITINRDLAAVLGVNIQDIADTVSAMMSGVHWTDLQAGNKSYQVLVQMRLQDFRNFDALSKLYVHSGASTASSSAGNDASASSADSSPESNHMVPVSNLVKLTPFVGQGTLTHFDRFRSGMITARLAPGYSESQAINFIRQHVQSVLTPHVRYAFSGKAQQFLSSASSMTGIMIMAVLLIYLVLAAQFGSFIDPLIVLLAVPLCIVGALLALKLSGGTMSIYSEIGFVTLIGMISKHGILITQFANTLRREGMSFSQALLQGASMRLRPILMTTAAMVFGTLPLAFAGGPGSIGRHEIGWVIVGGLIFGTFFSLFVVPIAYSYLGRFKKIS